jgi:hypothetical protein
LAIGGATIGSNALAVTGTTALSGLLTAAGGVSSTLTTDSTSSTTGSIITAGGISCQKALFVGTTSNFAGTMSAAAITTSGALTLGGTLRLPSAITTAAQINYANQTTGDWSTFPNANQSFVFTAGTDQFLFRIDAETGSYIFKTPTKTMLTLSAATGAATLGAGTTTAILFMNGQSGTGASKGWAILPQVAGVAAGIIGSENYVFGSSDTNLVIQAATGKSVKIFSNAGGTGVTINSAGTVTMNAYGAGTATFDGSGNITSSDIRIKYDVAEFVTPPGVLEAITPKTFKLISERDNVAVTFDKDGEKTSAPTPIDDTHIGFIANDIQSILPDAVDWSNTEDKILNYNDRALIAVLWNETKALKARLAALEAK